MTATTPGTDHGDHYLEYKKQVRGLVPLPEKNTRLFAPNAPKAAV